MAHASWALVLPIALSSATLARADVVWVGPGAHVTPQAAIDSATDGDVILFTAGTYPGFSVDDKQLFLAPGVPGSVVRCGASVVSNLSGPKAVVLADLTLESASSAAALTVSACAGAVRIQGCDLRSMATLSAGGLRVSASLNVVVNATSMLGGAGRGGWAQGPWGPVGISASGGDALNLHTSRIALHECQAIGGNAGVAQNWITFGFTGRGGAGIVCDGSFLFSNDSGFHGGRGGGLSLSSSLCFNSSWIQDMGRGGDGVTLAGAAPSQAWFTLPQFSPGGYGSSNCPYIVQEWPPARRFVPGPAGSSAGRLGGSSARHFSLATLVAGGASVPASFSGAPGELVQVVLSLAPDFVWSTAQMGIVGVSLAGALPPQAVGQLDASGSLTAPVTLPPLSVSTPNLTWHVQSYFTSPSGTVRVGPSSCLAQLP